VNKEEPYRDQAERLKQRIQKINEQVDGDSEKLPPREHVHRQKKKKSKWKVKYPVIRLLVLCFILLPIVIFSVISFRNNGVKVNGTQKTSGSSVGFETINLKKSNSDAEDTKEEAVKSTQETNKVTAADEKSVETSTQTEQPAESSLQTTNKGTDNEPASDKNSQPSEAVKSQMTTTAPQKTSGIIYHTVKPQETLYKLAMRYYYSKNGVSIIKRANSLQNENIYVGQVLKIPLN
jgi:LysM repeat protein